MANTNIQTGIESTWVCAGASDTLTCELSANIRTGVEIEATDITLESVTVTATLKHGAEAVCDIPAGAGNYAVVGVDSSVSKIVISNVPSGTYQVAIYQ